MVVLGGGGVWGHGVIAQGVYCPRTAFKKPTCEAARGRGWGRGVDHWKDNL